MPWRSRWSSARLSSTAASGANASVSSSWNEDASQTITAPGSSVPGSEASAVPTLPATTTGAPAVAVDVADQLDRRRLAVGAGERDELVLEQPPAELELADHAQPRARAPRAITGASRGTPGLLTTVAMPASRLRALLAVAHLHARLPPAAA